MKERFLNSKYRKPFLYSLFFFAAFLLFLYSTFPTEGIKRQVVSGIAANTPFEAEAQSVGIAPLLSVSIKGLKLYKSKDNVIEIESLKVSPSVFSVFSDNPKFPFKAKLGGGEIKGAFRINKSGGGIVELSADIKNVNIDKISEFLTGPGDSVALAGVMDGELYIDFAPEARGDFDIRINGLEVDKLSVKGIKLPPFSGLKSVFKGNIEGRKTTISECYVNGAGIDLQISGTAPLLWEFSKGGVIDLGYRLEITGEEFATYKGLLSPYLAKQRDGSLGGKILGTVSNPRFEKGSTKKF